MGISSSRASLSPFFQATSSPVMSAGFGVAIANTRGEFDLRRNEFFLPRRWSPGKALPLQLLEPRSRSSSGVMTFTGETSPPLLKSQKRGSGKKTLRRNQLGKEPTPTNSGEYDIMYDHMEGEWRRNESQ